MPSSLTTLYQHAIRLANRLSWIGPLAVRVVIGVAFVLTGWGKLHNLEQVTAYFASLHIPAPGAQAAFVATVEFVGGLMLILGLGTRIAAALLIGVMAVATLTAKLPEAESKLDLFSSIELTYLVTFIWLLLAGGGKASIDHAIDHAIARRGHDAVGEPA